MKHPPYFLFLTLLLTVMGEAQTPFTTTFGQPYPFAEEFDPQLANLGGRPVVVFHAHRLPGRDQLGILFLDDPSGAAADSLFLPRRKLELIETFPTPDSTLIIYASQETTGGLGIERITADGDVITRISGVSNQVIKVAAGAQGKLLVVRATDRLSEFQLFQYDQAGQLDWGGQIGGSRKIQATGGAALPNGEWLVCGADQEEETRGTVLRYDAQGELLWQKIFPDVFSVLDVIYDPERDQYYGLGNHFRSDSLTWLTLNGEGEELARTILPTRTALWYNSVVTWHPQQRRVLLSTYLDRSFNGAQLVDYQNEDQPRIIASTTEDIEFRQFGYSPVTFGIYEAKVLEGEYDRDLEIAVSSVNPTKPFFWFNTFGKQGFSFFEDALALQLAQDGTYHALTYESGSEEGSVRLVRLEANGTVSNENPIFSGPATPLSGDILELEDGDIIVGFASVASLHLRRYSPTGELRWNIDTTLTNRFPGRVRSIRLDILNQEQGNFRAFIEKGSGFNFDEFWGPKVIEISAAGEIIESLVIPDFSPGFSGSLVTPLKDGSFLVAGNDYQIGTTRVALFDPKTGSNLWDYVEGPRGAFYPILAAPAADEQGYEVYGHYTSTIPVEDTLVVLHFDLNGQLTERAILHTARDKRWFRPLAVLKDSLVFIHLVQQDELLTSDDPYFLENFTLGFDRSAHAQTHLFRPFGDTVVIPDRIERLGEELISICGRWYDPLTENSDAFLSVRPLSQFLLADDNPAVVQVPLRVFPNPAKNVATLEFDTPSRPGLRFSLYDGRGRMVSGVSTIPTGTVQQRIDLRSLFPGTYFLLIQSPDGSQRVEKLVRSSH